ncbi:MAG: NifB/NifX family molybdenum-iron cluster-binding protein [Phycisphaerae bacterium]|nr:NifB/NifX family molybdenum-iron cluster-binding protein [Phycisphaerae bacterium]
MRIAITASGPTLDANVDPRFGRCPYFLIVDMDTLNFEAVENPNVALGGGAGIQSAQLMAAKGVKFVLTGNCGPNAHETLSAAGIGVIPGCSGTVRDAAEQFKAGQLNTAGEPNVASHSGMADAPSSFTGQPGLGGGAGMGGGPGGGGGGRGMGRGGGQGRGRGGGGMGQGRGGGRGMGT